MARPNPDAAKAGPYRCPGCFLVPASCVCAAIPSVDNRLPVHIIRHSAEQYKTSNTARLACRALSRCEIHCWGAAATAADLPDFADGWLLFPEELDHLGKPRPDGPPVHDLALGPPSPPPRLLVVLDGTWGQARRMSHRIAGVARLPRLISSLATDRERARRPPHPDTLATLEALAWALHSLEGPDAGHALLELFDTFVAAFRKQCNKS